MPDDILIANVVKSVVIIIVFPVWLNFRLFKITALGINLLAKVDDELSKNIGITSVALLGVDVGGF